MYKTIISFTMTEILIMSKHISNRLKPDTYTWHKFIYSCFPKELNAKFSFNIKNVKCGKQLIIIQSNIKPQIPTFINENQIITKYYSDEDLIKRKLYNFIIDINSVTRKNDHYSYVKEDDIHNWLTKRFLDNGMELCNNINVISQQTDKFKGKANNKITVHVSRIAGTISILDNKKFLEAICTGIGREKSYGYGMLCIN